MRLVVDDHNPADMKRLSDFDRALNLLGELNDEFSNLAIIQLKKTSVAIVHISVLRSSSQYFHYYCQHNSFQS